jgi:hypothetical protein
MYAIDAVVLVALADLSGHGIILGELFAENRLDKRLVEWLSPFVGADTVDDTTVVPDGVVSNLGWKPVDCFAGDVSGSLSFYGSGVLWGKFYSCIKGSDLSALWTFSMDNLVRLVSYNFEHWTASGEKWSKNDESEINEVEKATLYQWESVGVRGPGTDAVPPGAGCEYQRNHCNDTLYYSGATTILNRFLNIRGYLGNGVHNFVLLPGSSEGGSDIKTTGLLDEQRHLNGFFSIRSAKGILFEKDIFIPVPEEEKRPEDPDGDSGNTKFGGKYSPAGYLPAGEGSFGGFDTKHKQPEFVESGPKFWDAVFNDYHEYMVNWLGIKNVILHEKDWSLAEENELNNHYDWYISESSLNTTVSSNSSYKFDARWLKRNHSLDYPDYKDIEIDHRTASRYYKSKSFIHMTDDGAVVISDGYGASITMAKGSITITAPGDIKINPGRSTVINSGDDSVIAAGSSVDVVADQGDVRVKSDRNMQLLSGNSGVGGTIIESRASDSEDKKIIPDYKGRIGENVVSSGVYIKTIGRENPVVIESDAVFMYGNPRNNIYTTGGVGSDFDNQGYIDRIDDIDELQPIHIPFTQLFIKGAVNSTNSSVPITPELFFQYADLCRILDRYQFEDTNLVDFKYDLIPAGFSFRDKLNSGDPSQYSTYEGYFDLEPTWQRHLRLQLNKSDTEDHTYGFKPVLDPDLGAGHNAVFTYAYPGVEFIETDKVFHQYISDLWDDEGCIRKNVSKTSAGYKEEEECGTVSKKRLKDNYMVTELIKFDENGEIIND